MRTLIVAGLAVTALSAVSSAQEAGILTGSQVREAVSGRTIYLDSPLGEVPIRYSSNGTMSATTELALLDGERTTSDRGKWWVSDDRLCIKWQNWMHKQPYCFTMVKIGHRRVAWRRSDGKTGTARLGS